MQESEVSIEGLWLSAVIHMSGVKFLNETKKAQIRILSKIHIIGKFQLTPTSCLASFEECGGDELSCSLPNNSLDFVLSQWTPLSSTPASVEALDTTPTSVEALGVTPTSIEAQGVTPTSIEPLDITPFTSHSRQSVKRKLNDTVDKKKQEVIVYDFYVNFKSKACCIKLTFSCYCADTFVYLYFQRTMYTFVQFVENFAFDIFKFLVMNNPKACKT